MYLSLLLTVLYFAGVVLTNNLFTPCKKSDASCIEKSANIALPQIFSGIPELGIESSDPQFLKFVEGNLSILKYKLFNSTVVGFKTCRISNLTFNDEFTSLRCDVRCTELSVNGQYEMEGRLIALPIIGKGDYSLSSHNYLISLGVELEHLKEDDGKTHLSIKNLKLDLKPINAKYVFQNLFNGQKDLEIAMNKYVQENWQEVAELFHDPIWAVSMKEVTSNVNKYLKLFATEDFMLN